MPKDQKRQNSKWFGFGSGRSFLPPLDTSLGAKQLRLGAPRAAAPAPPPPPPPPASEAAPAMETAIERALRCGARGNLWGVLGLQRGVSVEAARGALRAVRVATHPDRNRGSAATEAAATEAAKWVARAAEVLTDPERRGAYVDAGHSLAAYDEAMAAEVEAETRKRQRAEDEKEERKAKKQRQKAAVEEDKARREAARQGTSGEMNEARETQRRKDSSKRRRTAAKARQRETESYNNLGYYNLSSSKRDGYAVIFLWETKSYLHYAIKLFARSLDIS